MDAVVVLLCGCIYKQFAAEPSYQISDSDSERGGVPLKLWYW